MDTAQQPISYDPTQETPRPLIQTEDSSYNPVSPEVAASRALKASYGLFEKLPKPGYAELYQGMLNGQEKDLRESVAASLDTKDAMSVNSSLAQLARTPGLSATQFAAAAQRFIERPKNDPSSIFETNFADRYINSINNAYIGTGNPPQYRGWLSEVISEIPEHVEEANGWGKMLAARQQFLLKVAEDVEDSYNKQSYMGYGVDFLKGLFPGYTAVKLRSSGIVSPLEGALAGEHLEAIRKELMFSSFEEMKRKYIPFINQLKQDNPQLALRFAQSMLGQSLHDMFQSDVFDAMDISTVGSIAKGVGKAALGKVLLYNQYRRAIRDMVKQVDQTVARSPQEVAAGASGDIERAATIQTNSNITADIAGTSDPTKRAVTALPTSARLDIDALATGNPGNFGQDLVNRLADRIRASKALFQDKVETLMRVNRTPASLESPAQIEAEKKYIEQLHRGTDNQVINTIGPIYRPETNDHVYRLIIGRTDGGLFRDQHSIEENLGQNGIVVRRPINTKEIDSAIKELEEITSKPPRIDADVHELNFFAHKEEELSKLRAWKANLMARPLEGAKTLQGTIAEAMVKPSPKLSQTSKKYLEGLTKDVFPEVQPGIKTPSLEELPPVPSTPSQALLPKLEGQAEVMVHQSGLGWYGELEVPRPETTELVRAGLLKNTAANIPDSWAGGWLNAAIGWFRTPEETLSMYEKQARYIATHGPSVLLPLYRAVDKPISKISRKEWPDFSKFIKAVQKGTDPETGEPGWFPKTLGDVEHWYLQNIGRAPSEREVEGFYAWQTTVEFDNHLRTLARIGQKTRDGAMSHSLTIRGPDGNPLTSKFFDAVKMLKLPTENDESILVSIGGKVKVYRTNQVGGKKARDKLQNYIDTGQAQLVRVYSAEEKPLAGFGGITDNRVKYILSDKIGTKPLSYADQVPTRPGGHLVPEYSHYIKQAIMDTDVLGNSKLLRYQGDRTIMAVMNGAMGRTAVTRMNAVISLLKANKDNEAKALMNSREGNFGLDFDQFASKFRPSVDPQGNTIPAELTYDPFHVVPVNKTIKSLGVLDDKVIDDTRGMLSTQLNGHQDARDLWALRDIGTKGNPIFQHEPAKFVDPITMMNRALSKITNSMYMDDYKMFAVEHWIQQAKPYLNVPETQLNAAPFHYFFNINKNDWNSSNPIAMSTLMGNRRKALDFMGVPSVVDSFMHTTMQTLADATYTKFGPGAGLALAKAWEIPLIKNPIQFAKTMTYHLKLGLFSVPQFFTQAMTVSNIVAMSPQHTMSAAPAVLFHQWVKFNRSPEILDHFDKLLGNFGWRPGEFKEFISLADRTGFPNVGVEHAFLDTPLSTKFIRNGFDTFLDWGTAPFRAGAGMVRSTALAVAYREFRHGGGGKFEWAGQATGAISRADEEQILARAALLDHNQSRASSSILHTGVMAPIGQFLSYNLRLMEMMTGKRLTGMEKARLFGVSSVLYGLPMGGLGLYGFPAAPYLERVAKEHGYTDGDNLVSTFAMRGAPAMLMAAITGRYYNVAEKWGVHGIDPLGEGLQSDKSFLHIFGGASASTFGNMLSQSSGLYRSLMSMITGTGIHEAKIDDILDLLKESVTANAGIRLYKAMNAGRWMSKNEAWQTDVSKLEAIMLTISGLSPQDSPDTWNTQQMLKGQKEYMSEAESEFKKEYRRGLNSTSKDPDQAASYFRRADGILKIYGYPEEKRESLILKAIQENRSAFDNANFDWATRDVPTHRAFSLDPTDPTETRHDVLRRQIQLQGKY